MKVMGSRALVRRMDPPQGFTGLIEVVELDRQPSQYAEIVYVGTKNNTEIAIGDKILIGSYSGAPVTINNEMLYFINYTDILAVLEP